MVVRDIDQLWAADITYIRLQSEFVYLGVVIDAYSRRLIGWALDRTVEDDLPCPWQRCGAPWNCGGPRQ
jgi:transposase InsO family protein